MGGTPTGPLQGSTYITGTLAFICVITISVFSQMQGAVKGQSMPRLPSLSTVFSVSANFVYIAKWSLLQKRILYRLSEQGSLKLINVVLNMYLLNE